MSDEKNAPQPRRQDRTSPTRRNLVQQQHTETVPTVETVLTAAAETCTPRLKRARQLFIRRVFANTLSAFVPMSW